MRVYGRSSYLRPLTLPHDGARTLRLNPALAAHGRVIPVFFEPVPVQLHLQAAHLAVEPIRRVLLRCRFRTTLALKARPCLLNDCLLPLADLHRVNPVGLTHLVDGLDPMDRLTPDLGLELGVVCVPLPLLAHLFATPCWRLCHRLSCCPDFGVHYKPMQKPWKSLPDPTLIRTAPIQ